jgi:hypothetical protein
VQRIRLDHHAFEIQLSKELFKSLLKNPATSAKMGQLPI